MIATVPVIVAHLVAGNANAIWLALELVLFATFGDVISTVHCVIQWSEEWLDCGLDYRERINFTTFCVFKNEWMGENIWNEKEWKKMEHRLQHWTANDYIKINLSMRIFQLMDLYNELRVPTTR